MGRLETRGQVIQVLGQYPCSVQKLPEPRSDLRSDGNEFAAPMAEAAMARNKDIRSVPEPLERSNELIRIPSTRPKANALLRLRNRYKVDLNIATIPEAANAFAERKVAKAAAAALLVELACQILQSKALNQGKILVCLSDEIFHGTKRSGRDWALKGREPRSEKIITDVVASSASLRRRKNGELSLDHPITIREDFEIATDLLCLSTPRNLGDGSIEICIGASGIPGDILKDHVVAPAQFAEEPIVSLTAERRRTGEEKPLKQRAPICAQHTLFKGIAVKLGNALEKIPEEEQSLGGGIGVGGKDLEDGGYVEVPKLEAIRGAVEKRRVAIFQECSHLRMQRSQDNEPAIHL